MARRKFWYILLRPSELGQCPIPPQTSGCLNSKEMSRGMKPDWGSDLRTTSEIIAHLGVPKDIVHIWISDESILAPKIERLWKYHAR